MAAEHTPIDWEKAVAELEAEERAQEAADRAKLQIRQGSLAAALRALRDRPAPGADAKPDPWPEPIPLAEGKRLLSETFGNYLDRVRAGEKDFQVGAIATSGFGKSRQFITAARDRIKSARAVDAPVDAPDGKPDFDGPFLYLVPTARVAEELAHFYNHEGPGADGGGAVTFRGRVQKDDDHQEPLCFRAPAVAEAMKLGLYGGIGRAFCKGKDEQGNERQCPHFHVCPYQDQFDPMQGAEMIFATHELLTINMGDHKLPKPVAIVVDENPTASLLAKARRFSPDATREAAGEHVATVEVVLSALASRRDAREVLRESQEPALTRKGLTRIASAIEGPAAKLQLHPGMSDGAVHERLKTMNPRPVAAHLLRRIAAEWDTDRELRGVHYVPKVKVKTKDDGYATMPMIELQHRKQIIPRFRKVPLLLLDGSGEPDLLRAIWPTMEFVRIDVPRNMHMTQIVGRTFAASSWSQRNEKGDKELSAPGRKKAAAITGYQATLPTPGVAIAQKVFAAALSPPPAGWMKPTNFGALRGMDKFKGIRTIIVIGRTQPSAKKVERDARALFYDRDVPLNLTGGYGRRSATDALGEKTYVRLRDPKGTLVRDWRHNDPLVDLIRAGICEREVEQAIDRARLVHRDEPCRVVLVGETPTRFKVDEVLQYNDLIGDRIARAMRRLGGYLPLRPVWLAHRFPDLWPTVDAASHAAKRATAGATVRVWHFRLVGQRGPRPTPCWAPTDADTAAVMAFLARVGPVSSLSQPQS